MLAQRTLLPSTRHTALPATPLGSRCCSLRAPAAAPALQAHVCKPCTITNTTQRGWRAQRPQTAKPTRLQPSSALGVGADEIMMVSEGLETPIQLMYLLALLGFLSVGAFLVVRQVLIRRELDEAAKGLGERIRTGEATCEDYFELGVILTRKKLFTQATKNLEKAKRLWDGEETELAQVHNALGYCYINMERNDLAAAEYKRAVELQPGYVTAWNNLGDAYEKNKQWREALSAYEEAVSYAPSNQVALQRSEFCREKINRLSTTSL